MLGQSVGAFAWRQMKARPGLYSSLVAGGVSGYLGYKAVGHSSGGLNAYSNNLSNLRLRSFGPNSRDIAAAKKSVRPKQSNAI